MTGDVKCERRVQRPHAPSACSVQQARLRIYRSQRICEVDRADPAVADSKSLASQTSGHAKECSALQRSLHMREEPCKLIDARDNLDPPAHALSRRQALARFTFLTAGLALGGIQSRAFAATNPVTAGLGPSHLTTLGALDETYALAGAMGTKAIDAKSELGRLYATRSDDWRQTALLVLETLEAAPSAASFSRLTVRQRRDELLSWGNPPDKAASGDIRTLIAKLGSVRGPTPNEMIDPWPGVALPSVRYALPPAPLGPVAPLPDPQSETQQLRRLRVMAFDLMLALYFDDARGLNDFAYLPSL